MYTLTLDKTNPWTPERVAEIVAQQPPAIVKPGVKLPGYNWPSVSHLGSNEYIAVVADPDGRVLRYGVMDESGFEDLLARIQPMSVNDAEYPAALAGAIDMDCYFASEVFDYET